VCLSPADALALAYFVDICKPRETRRDAAPTRVQLRQEQRFVQVGVTVRGQGLRCPIHRGQQLLGKTTHPPLPSLGLCHQSINGKLIINRPFFPQSPPAAALAAATATPPECRPPDATTSARHERQRSSTSTSAHDPTAAHKRQPPATHDTPTFVGRWKPDHRFGRPLLVGGAPRRVGPLRGKPTGRSQGAGGGKGGGAALRLATTVGLPGATSLGAHRGRMRECFVQTGKPAVVFYGRRATS